MTITDRLKNRPTYQGLAIPYTVIVVNGIPDFKATDMERWWECVDKKLCALCGEGLDYWVWYIGGPSCADSGVYFDLAMHEECAFYSVSVCPFLARGKDYAKHPQAPEGYTLTIYPAPRHPGILFASKRRRDQVKPERDGNRYLVKTGPEVERVQIYPPPAREIEVKV